MKKIIFMCLTFIMGAAFYFPSVSLAAQNSLLDGKIVTPGKNARAPLTTTTFVTDNDENTYFPLEGEKGSPTVQDFLIYNFETPQDISAFKLYVKNYTGQKFAIGFIDTSNKEILFKYDDGKTGGDNGIYDLPSTVENVKTAVVWNYVAGAPILNVIEWGLYNGDPSLEPNPEPEQPTGSRAILVVTMTTGLEKEYDLSMQEVNSFISWYEAKRAGSGKASYAIDKHDNNKGPFSSRKDYILYNRVLTFEVNEY